jgi:hypothetical protein
VSVELISGMKLKQSRITGRTMIETNDFTYYVEQLSQSGTQFEIPSVTGYDNSTGCPVPDSEWEFETTFLINLGKNAGYAATDLGINEEWFTFVYPQVEELIVE